MDLIIEAPAKINLLLDIKGKRPDHYHELETVMHAVDLVDLIHITPASSGVEVITNSALIPDGEQNLAHQAATLFLEKNGITAGIRIFIEKNIPIGAGLAGGSTDAAAVLKGLNQVFGTGLSQDRLMQLAEKLGSDVPFCLLGGTALARGRGEILTPLPPVNLSPILLVKPGFQVSTAEVYRLFDLTGVSQIPDLAAFLAAWRNYDIIKLTCQLDNVLESVCLKRYPQIAVIKEQLEQMGAYKALMSGSGPTVFALFPNQELAFKAQKEFSKRYSEVYLVSSYNRGG